MGREDTHARNEKEMLGDGPCPGAGIRRVVSVCGRRPSSLLQAGRIACANLGPGRSILCAPLSGIRTAVHHARCYTAVQVSTALSEASSHNRRPAATTTSCRRQPDVISTGQMRACPSNPVGWWRLNRISLRYPRKLTRRQIESCRTRFQSEHNTPDAPAECFLATASAHESIEPRPERQKPTDAPFSFAFIICTNGVPFFAPPDRGSRTTETTTMPKSGTVAQNPSERQ